MSVRKHYSRRQRLRSADIAALIKGGRPFRCPGFSIRVGKNALGYSRFAVIVPKRIFPRAVDRNRMKRLLREWFRNNQATLGDSDLVVRLTGKTAAFDAISDMLVQSP